MARRQQYATIAALLLAQRTIAQSTSLDPLGVIVSEAYSVYTAVTGSYLPSVESAASAAAASASSLSSEVANGETTITSRSSTSTISSSSSASTSAPTSTRAANTSSPTNLAASVTAASSAAAASASASSSKHHGGSNTLAIALGAGLGALALGLLLLVAILLCCRRRRRSRDSAKHSVLSPDDDEVAGWRRPAHRQNNTHGTHPEMVGTAPLMADHPAYRHDRERENPFADPVPAERQLSAPNSRAGLTDSSVPGDDPYMMHGSGRPVRKSSDGHHVGGALAAGAGGAALGAVAMRHHNRSGRDLYDEKHDLADGGAFGTAARPNHDQHGHVQYDEKHHSAFVHELGSGTGTTDNPRSPVSPLPVDDHVDRPIHESKKDHHMAEALAAGAGGIAVGAAATHHNSKHDSGNSTEMQDQSRIGGRPISRKPIPSSNIPTEHAGPYPTPSTNDDAFALNQTPGRRSMDSSHRRHSRDPARANEAFNNAYSSDPHRGHHDIPTAAALGAGAVGGAALAHHTAGQNRSRSNSAHASRSPHRRSLLATKANGSDNSSSSDSKDYKDAVPHQTLPNSTSDPHDVPPIPITRSRRNSSLGTGAPPGAVNSYVNAPQPPRDRSTSSTRPHSYPYDHNDYPTNVPNSARTRTSSPPFVPSRSPHRNSRDSPPFTSNVRTESPLRNQLEGGSRSRSESVNEVPEGYDVGSPYDHPDLSSPSAPAMQRAAGMNQGIVGDNGYPTMTTERRNSSPRPAPDMYNAKRISSPRPTADRFDSHRWENGYPVVSNGSGERRNSSPRPDRDDDASYRVSHGMPGGWQRAPGGQRSGRNSMEQGRKSINGKRSSSQGRLRLSDLRREEEEKARSSGMWFGGGQRYYEAQGYEGVGQAL